MSESASASADKYADYSREQLLAEINRLKKNKKYGLVWEHKTEKVIEDFETQQPYLREVIEKRIENAPDEPTNLIIEGDNFEALSVLNYTHAGKVDVIYIDPPYNTGNKDFIYNDNYVDSEDEFRHSKWLSFMEPRLKLAKNLLKDDGVIFISIDDNEQASLRHLCDDVFGSENFLSFFIWRKNNDEVRKNVSKVLVLNEYILCYQKSNTFSGLFAEAKIPTDMKNPDNDPRGDWFNANISNPVTRENEKNVYTVRIHGHDIRRRWFKDRDVIEKWIEDNRIYLPIKNGIPGAPRLKMFREDFDSKKKTANNFVVDYSTTDGRIDLEKIMKAGLFSYPKPVGLIKVLTSYYENKNSVILDFFAGSGTTGQAVLELNIEDGGHRQFILCTNNGDKGPDSVKIAEDITYPRVKTVITGERLDGSKYSDGIPANLRYYKIEHKEKKASIDANRLEIVRYLEDIIQVKENAFEQIEVNEDLALYKNSERFVGMVFEPFALEEIVENIKEKNSENKPVKLYVFSYSRDAFEDNYGADFEIEFVAMPEGLLKTYANIVAETKKEDE